MSECSQARPAAARSRPGAVGVGLICPYDFGLDRELWRWVPDAVSLVLTRTPHHVLPVSVQQAETVSALPMVTACARTLVETSPPVVAYACTSGSFIRGMPGEKNLRHAIEAAGVPRGLTTSGALLSALRALGARRLAVATPYDEMVTTRLATFLQQGGVEVTSSAFAGLTERIWNMDTTEVARLVRRSLPTSGAADAVFVSCTNVPTLDLIEPLERELGIPVLSANQVTLWAALGAVGLRLATPGQRLAAAVPDTADTDAATGLLTPVTTPHEPSTVEVLA